MYFKSTKVFIKIVKSELSEKVKFILETKA